MLGQENEAESTGKLRMHETRSDHGEAPKKKQFIGKQDLPLKRSHARRGRMAHVCLYALTF